MCFFAKERVSCRLLFKNDRLPAYICLVGLYHVKYNIQGITIYLSILVSTYGESMDSRLQPSQSRAGVRIVIPRVATHKQRSEP